MRVGSCHLWAQEKGESQARGVVLEWATGWAEVEHAIGASIGGVEGGRVTSIHWARH